jgi:hypothetical protein
MEELLGVARREHSKAVLQLQQLSRKVASGSDKAAEVAEMGRAKIEEELNSARKQLQSVMVERNLLLVSSQFISPIMTALPWQLTPSVIN